MSPQLSWWLPLILFLVLTTPAAGLGLPAHTLDNNVNLGTMGTDDFWPPALVAFLLHQPNPLCSLDPAAPTKSFRYLVPGPAFPSLTICSCLHLEAHWVLLVHGSCLCKTRRSWREGTLPLISPQRPTDVDSASTFLCTWLCDLGQVMAPH